MILAIGPYQIILVFFIPLAFFLLGYFIGKKSGYIKRIKEVEERHKLNS